ncbi:MAG: signal peptidase I [Proteobacteria bacterium]|nr:signal peptidase I [Pseudomonadota bacterium]
MTILNKLRGLVPGGCTSSCENGKKKKKGQARETVEAIIIAILLALFIRTFILQAFKIPSSSMEDTLLVGDHLLVNKFSYGLQVPLPAMITLFGVRVPFFETKLYNAWGSVKRGDIIVFRYPNDRTKDYIKRVVAIGGDSILIKRDVLFINGKPTKTEKAVFKGSYVRGSSIIRDFGPYTVPKDRVFVMGDNRDNSYDSRYWGLEDPANITVPVSEIKGKAFIIYWSWDSVKASIRARRFLDIIR